MRRHLVLPLLVLPACWLDFGTGGFVTTLPSSDDNDSQFDMTSQPTEGTSTTVQPSTASTDGSTIQPADTTSSSDATATTSETGESTCIPPSGDHDWMITSSEPALEVNLVGAFTASNGDLLVAGRIECPEPCTPSFAIADCEAQQLEEFVQMGFVVRMSPTGECVYFRVTDQAGAKDPFIEAADYDPISGRVALAGSDSLTSFAKPYIATLDVDLMDAEIAELPVTPTEDMNSRSTIHGIDHRPDGSLVAVGGCGEEQRLHLVEDVGTFEYECISLAGDWQANGVVAGMSGAFVIGSYKALEVSEGMPETGGFYHEYLRFIPYTPGSEWGLDLGLAEEVSPEALVASGVRLALAYDAPDGVHLQERDLSLQDVGMTLVYSDAVGVTDLLAHGDHWVVALGDSVNEDGDTAIVRWSGNSTDTLQMGASHTQKLTAGCPGEDSFQAVTIVDVRSTQILRSTIFDL